MPIPAAVTLGLKAAPFIASGLKGLVGLFKKKDQVKQQGVDLQKLLASIPQLRSSLGRQEAQAARVDPLHQALVAMSQRLMPNLQGGGPVFNDPWGGRYEEAINRRLKSLGSPDGR